MKKLNTLAVAGLFGLVVAHGTGALAADLPTVGAVEKVQAKAEAVNRDAVRTLNPGAPVIFADRLQTGEASRLQSMLKDGTQLTLGERAMLVVDEYVYDPSQDGGKLALKVVEGAFLFVGGKIEGKTGGNVDIRTPVGTLGVRGTTVWGGRIDGGYGILVLDGEVRLQTHSGSVTLNAGQATMVYEAGGEPAMPHAWPQEKIDRAVATISFR